MESFGATLKREREKRKISLDDVSATTKISNRFLTAIESDHFDQLPGGIFNRGFIRAYARHLGLDEDQVVRQYLEASGEENPTTPIEPEVVESRSEENVGKARSVPWKELAALVLLAVVASMYWKFRLREKSSAHEETAAPTGVSTTPSQLAESNAAVLAPPVSRKPVVPGAQVFQLRIVAREDSWISISGPEGEILHQILSPPEEKSFNSRGRIIVKTGNVGGLDFYWNGRPIGPQGKEGEVKTLIFDGTGYHSPPPSPPTVE